jgi:hypothetical protein
LASRGDTIDKAIALQSDQDVVDRLRQRMPDAIKQLEDIACGNVPRNAQQILKGIETLLRFSQPLPKQVVEHQGAIGIAVVDPYAEEPSVDGELLPQTAPLALPPPAAVAVAPIRRRRPPAPAAKEPAE